MRIIPGYDFFSTETPDRAKLGLMASGMSIVDIGLAQINTALVAVKVEDTTQVTLPGEGWLWVDARNNVWGRTRLGNVIVRKAEGGWESLRYRYGVGGTASVYSIPGEMIQFAGMINGDTNESNCVLVVIAGGSFTGATWQVGVTQETVPSLATDVNQAYYRTVYRGMTRMFGPEFTPVASTFGRGRAWRNSAFSNWWIFTDVTDNEGRVVYGDVGQRDNDGQTDYVYGYFYPGLVST